MASVKYTAGTSKRTCKHCGGIMADYRGMVTCMMCGRSSEHICENCDSKHKEGFSVVSL